MDFAASLYKGNPNMYGSKTNCWQIVATDLAQKYSVGPKEIFISRLFSQRKIISPGPWLVQGCY